MVNPYKPSALKFPIVFEYPNESQGIGRVSFRSRKVIHVICPGLGRERTFTSIADYVVGEKQAYQSLCEALYDQEPSL